MAADTEKTSSTEQKARIFVSYSRKDMAFADRLEAALKARGFEPLIDRTEIYAFEDWWERIEALIGRADTVVFVLSPEAVASDVALKEVAYAASVNKRFAPIVCKRVDDSAVPEPLQRLNFIFFDEPERFEASADRLAEALQTDISWIRRHTEFGEAARRWEETGRAGGLLLRPPMLDQAEAWITYRPHSAPLPTAETQAFVTESRRVEVATSRRNRILHAALYIMLVGIIAGLFGWINQDYIEEQANWFWIMRPYMLANVRPYVLTAVAERALQPLASFRECANDCPEMIVIPAGKLQMGSPANEKGRQDNENPIHSVTIARAFAVSKFDVTFADWDTCVSVGGCPQASDSGYGRGTKPAINVNLDEALQYVAWFSKMTGKPYRLLTEAEWEYATRAGTKTAYWWGDEIGKGNANCIGCDSKWENQETSSVGSFKPNAFGLYDVAGNVYQWVQDCYHDNYDGVPIDGSVWAGGDCSRHVVRGGSWRVNPPYLRSASRDKYSPGTRISVVGFRIARALNP